MDTTTVQDNRELAAAKKRALDAAFYRKGIAIAALSSCMYALYTAFVTAGQLFGVWVDWFGTLDPTSLLVVFILPTIASGINDTLSAVWATLFTVKQGQIGAILACIFYKQPIGPRVGVGIGVCALAGAMIGGAGLGGQPAPGMALGLGLALLAALCWGIEGCVGGRATCMVDPQIAINIRQLVSGLGNLCLVLPVLSLACGESLGLSYTYVAHAFTDGSSIAFFACSGFAAYFSFMSWYRANAMCGTALGMAINGTYTFTAPLLTWVIVGLVLGFDGYALPSVAWIAAVVNLVGICLIAVNPLDVFKKVGGSDAAA